MSAKTSRFSGFILRLLLLSVISQIAFFLVFFGLQGIGIDLLTALFVAGGITLIAYYAAYTRFIAGRTFRRGL